MTARLLTPSTRSKFPALFVLAHDLKYKIDDDHSRGLRQYLTHSFTKLKFLSATRYHTINDIHYSCNFVSN